MADFYKQVFHTADLGIQLTSDTLPGIYINSARALTDLIAGIKNIRPLSESEITVEGIDSDDLLIRWLNELIYIYDTERKIFSDFKITDLTDTKLHCKVKGEIYNPNEHIIKNDIKAATYYNASIERTEARFKVTIIFDV